MHHGRHERSDQQLLLAVAVRVACCNSKPCHDSKCFTAMQLLGCLRVIVGTPEELQLAVEGSAVPQEGPLSPENEVQVGP